jgi:N-acetylneuraminic acid mutarotase
MYKNLRLNLLFLSVIKVIYGQNFIPEPRFGQEAVPIGDRIYYIGGMGYSTKLKNSTFSSFFYLEANK